jgi:hypothetical protein
MKKIDAFDHDFFAVLCRHDGTSYFAELTEPQTEQSIITAIADGQLEHVQAIFKFNPVEGHSRDISEDVARAIIGRYLDNDGDAKGPAEDFLEDHLGCQAVAEAVREHRC